MTKTTIHTSFAGGEISPSLWGRVDLAKFQAGGSTVRNMFVNYRGGASSRAGLAWVGQCLQPFGTPPRDIEFQAGINQGYVLEFGDNVVTRAVTGAANNAGQVRLQLVSTRGLMTGNTMVVTGIVGTTEANGTWEIVVDDATHVTLVGTAFVHAYVSGGSTSTSAGYMRIKSNGAYVIEDDNAITAITKANPGVFSYTNTNYTLQNGDWVYITGVNGMENFNGLTWIVDNATSTTFTLKTLFGAPVNTTTFDTYTSGGSLSRIYTIVSPYAAVDLPFLKFTQDKATMSLTCINQDTLTEYTPYDLVSNDITDWDFVELTFAASITAPANLSVTAHPSTTLSTYYSYVVTAVSAETGEESVASAADEAQNNDISVNAGSNSLTWDTVTGASSYNIYRATPQYGASVPPGVLYGYVGTSLGENFVDTNIIADFTKVPPTHKNPFARAAIVGVTITNGGSGYTSGGIGYSITTSTGSGFVGTPLVTGGALAGFLITSGGSGYANADTITITGGATTASGYITFTANPANNNTITLNSVVWTFTSGAPGAAKTVIQSTLAATLAQLVSDVTASGSGFLTVATYNATTTRFNITYGSSGAGGNAYTLASAQPNAVVSAATLTGGGSGGGATATLVLGSASGTYPGVVAYYQQRRAYANTINRPDTYFMSQPGAYTNFDSSIPVSDSDAITGAPWAQQINGIQFMQPMTNGLIILTGSGAWLLNGGTNATITPSSQTATSQAYNGCNSKIQPIVVNFDILYVQSKGSIVRDLSYNFFANIFTGTDMTILSNHLFNYHQLVQWAYAEEPYKLIWCVRDDGIMLSLTYLKEQDVYAWSRHDTNGFFVGISSVTEPPVDAVYVITQRYINGQWLYYSERMDNRNWQNAEDCFCVDAGLAYPMSFPAATLVPAAANGTSNISLVNVIASGSSYIAPVITAVDATGQGTGATFSVTLSGGAITAVTALTEGANYTEGLTTLEVTDSTGSGAILQPIITNIITFTTSSSVLTANNVGDVIRIGNNDASVTTNNGVTSNGGGKAIITSYVSGTEVEADILEPITAVITDDPNERPVPAISGQWSLSTPTEIVRGLNHLEGMEVAILADGAVIPNQIVVNGAITLPQSYSSIVVGLPFVVQLQTLYLEPAGERDTMQGERKNITSVVMRVEASRGWSTGTNQPDNSTQPNNATVSWTDMTEVKQRNALVQAGNAIPLATGDFYQNVDGNWSPYGQAAAQQIYPLPLNCLAMVISYEKGDTQS